MFSVTGEIAVKDIPKEKFASMFEQLQFIFFLRDLLIYFRERLGRGRRRERILRQTAH